MENGISVVGFNGASDQQVFPLQCFDVFCSGKTICLFQEHSGDLTSNGFPLFAWKSRNIPGILDGIHLLMNERMTC